MFGIVPVTRRDVRRRDGDLLAGCSSALTRGDIVIVYPEGTRGQPERLACFRPGVAHLAERHPDVPVVPVFIHGLGKFQPKGALLTVPFACQIHIGKPLHWTGNRVDMISRIELAVRELALKAPVPEWT